MTDNRTAELREKLDALGIEHKDFDLSTEWRDKNGVKWNYFANKVCTELSMVTPLENITPEQAIAATLGESIIRCRDCKYYHDGTTNGRRYAEPHCLAIGELAYGALFEVDEDCFCSWGGRSARRWTDE